MISRLAKILCIVLAVGITLLADIPARADSFEDFRGMAVAGDQEINEARGGYVTEGGLTFSIGIEKTILVNGIQQAANTLNIVQDGSGIPRVTQTPHDMTTLVQIGPGNTFEPGDLPSGFFTVVQNSLDQQFIQNITKISTTISVLGLTREIGKATTLDHQMVQSLR